MKNKLNKLSVVSSALSNQNRLQILIWLKDPVANFPQQVDGDLITDGVCLGAIADKIDVSQPTVTAYMRTLSNAGLTTSKRLKKWTFHKLNQDGFKGISAFLDKLSSDQ